MLIVVVFALVVWVGALYSLLAAGDRIHTQNQWAALPIILLMAITWPLAAMVVAAAGLAEGLWPERRRRLFLGEQF